jgi:hypothetical protein
MRRFFWPLLATLLLEGWFLNLPLWWIVTAAAIALSVRLACGVVKAHRAQEELIARFNDENPPQPRKSLAMSRRALSPSPRPAEVSDQPRTPQKVLGGPPHAGPGHIGHFGAPNRFVGMGYWS